VIQIDPLEHYWIEYRGRAGTSLAEYRRDILGDWHVADRSKDTTSRQNRSSEKAIPNLTLDIHFEPATSEPNRQNLLKELLNESI
jgi:hypothetical protein